MESLNFTLKIVAFLIIIIVIVRIWMNAANNVGEGIRQFFVELWRKLAPNKET